MGRELPQGRRVGNYAVERLLEKGGLQASYEARQVRTERHCVLTVYYLDPDAEPWARFRRETEQLQALQHPSLIEVLDVGIAHDGTPYQVTELCPGEDLKSRLRRSGALTLGEALALARQVGAALHAGHGVGVLHRDIRPENLFILTPDQEGRPAAANGDGESASPGFERVKVLHFGRMHLLEATLSGTALAGDPEYLSPEQILLHPTEVDPRTDQYSLAVVLYQALTTSRPFRGDSPYATLMQVTRGTPEPLRALRPDIPPHVDAAIARAMSRDRDARFPDTQTFLQALQEGVPLPIGMAELTEPWLSPPADIEEATRRAIAAGAVPQAPLSLGVSAALLARATQQQPEAAPPESAEAPGVVVAAAGTEAPAPMVPAEVNGTSSAEAVPQSLPDQPTVPYSMEAVMQLAVPPAEATPAEAVPSATELEPTQRMQETEAVPPVLPSLDSGAEEVSGPLEIVAEYTDDGRPIPQKGETEVLRAAAGPQEVLPSIIVDLPTRPLSDADRVTRISSGPTDSTQQSQALSSTGKSLLPDRWQRIARRLNMRASLVERIAWALLGAGVGTLLGHFLS